MSDDAIMTTTPDSLTTPGHPWRCVCADCAELRNTPPATRPTLEEATGALSGWDELAIVKHFGRPLEKLDGLTVMRALAFAQRLRAGDAAPDAYQWAMAQPVAGVKESFRADDPAAGFDDDDPSAQALADAEELAAFCLLTGQSPDTYRSLTRIERDAFVRVASRK